MRRHFLTTVAALAIATPAFADSLGGGLSGGNIAPSGDRVYSSAPMVVGDIEFNLAKVWSEDEKGEFDFNTFQGWGRANIPAGGSWNILVELGGGASFGGDASDAESGANFNAILRVMRNPNYMG